MDKLAPAPAPRLRHLRAAEIAASLGVSVRTVRRWIADGIVPSVKVGGARLVEEADLERILRPEEASFSCNDAVSGQENDAR